jgi:hypothetical protein
MIDQTTGRYQSFPGKAVPSSRPPRCGRWIADRNGNRAVRSSPSPASPPQVREKSRHILLRGGPGTHEPRSVANELVERPASGLRRVGSGWVEKGISRVWRTFFQKNRARYAGLNHDPSPPCVPQGPEPDLLACVPQLHFSGRELRAGRKPRLSSRPTGGYLLR